MCNGRPRTARANALRLLVKATVQACLAASSREGELRAAAIRSFWCKTLNLPSCGAPPQPALTPAPTTPKPTGPQKYCPDPKQDFQEEVEGPPGKVEWSESGWTIHGQRRVSSKTSFDLRGGYVEFDLDLANARGGVNTNLYITFPPRPNCGIKCYCDSGATGGCAELDFIENNGNCFAQTTFHDAPDGSNKAGFGAGGGIGPKVHVRADFTPDGATLDVTVNGNKHSGPGVGGMMDAHGAVLYSSQWVGWVPGTCPGDGNLNLASFSVLNLKIVGKVKQGPTPRRCDQAGSAIIFK